MASATDFAQEAALGGRQPPSGALTYEMDVFRVIAQRAVRAVKGVEKIYDGRSNGLLGSMGRKAGISCRETKHGLIVDVCVIARQFIMIHDLCRSIQESVAAAVLKMTNRSDMKVNVTIKGLT